MITRVVLEDGHEVFFEGDANEFGGWLRSANARGGVTLDAYLENNEGELSDRVTINLNKTIYFVELD